MDLALGACKSINGVLSGPARHALHVQQVNHKILRLSSLFFAFLNFSWLCRSYRSMFMSKPTRNHFSAIQCSQIRKSCWNASIIDVISSVNQL